MKGRLTPVPLELRWPEIFKPQMTTNRIGMKRIMKTATRNICPFASYADVPKTYRGLCQLYLPRPIHDANETRLRPK